MSIKGINLTDQVLDFINSNDKILCVSSCHDEAPPLSDFPIMKPECDVPEWLKLGFKKVSGVVILVINH